MDFKVRCRVPLAWIPVYRSRYKISQAIKTWLAKQHDIDYSKAKSLADKHIAERRMVAGIDKFPGKKSLTEQIISESFKLNLKQNCNTSTIRK